MPLRFGVHRGHHAAPREPPALGMETAALLLPLKHQLPASSTPRTPKSGKNGEKYERRLRERGDLGSPRPPVQGLCFSPKFKGFS